jgi:rubrerythrin
MPEPTTIDEILDFAIEREQEAADFYNELAGSMATPAMQGAFRQFAKEEMGHKAKLQGVKAGKKLAGAAKAVQDLKIGDYLVDVAPTPDMDYQKALIIAMKREKASYRLYMDLSARVPEGEVNKVLVELANEEARHKLRFETEYDEHFLTEN